MPHNNSPQKKVAPGLGLRITPWRGQLSSVIRLPCLRLPWVDFLLRSVYSYIYFAGDYSIENLHPPSKVPMAATGTGRFLKNIIINKNMVIYFNKVTGESFLNVLRGAPCGAPAAWGVRDVHGLRRLT
jgi:hypothetical protein